MMGPQVQCLKCKDIIQSKHQRDFVWCSCKTIYVDGGNGLTRLGGDLSSIHILGESTLAQIHKQIQSLPLPPE